MRHDMSKMKELTDDFNVISRKNNQTSVSDADQEIPTLGQRIMPETQ